MHSFIRASASLLIAASALLVPPTRNPVVRETRVGSDIIISIKHSLPWPRSPHTARTTSPGHQFRCTGCTGDHRGRRRDRGSTNAKGGAKGAGMSPSVVTRWKDDAR
jgi:hypothetical protein